MKHYADEVMTLLSKRRGHYTADEIWLLLKPYHPRLALATVYNNLKSLCEKQLIRKISVDSYPDRYEANARHDHLLCTRCGKLSDITLADLTESLRNQTGLDTFSYDLKIHYLCDACKEAAHNPDHRTAFAGLENTKKKERST